jgi:glycosyltransferase involved in cell wall biosynthesis
MDASVIICTRNRRESLVETLSSLARQVCETPWEVLVVDNASSDDSAGAVRDLAPSFPVPLRLEHESRQGLNFARNQGVEQARGEILLFTDDDVTCRPGWISAHVKAFAHPSVVGTAGRILPRLPIETPAWLAEILKDETGGVTARYDFGSEPLEIEPGKLPLPFGANMGVRRARAHEVGGFRTDLDYGKQLMPSGDVEFFQRVRSAGGRLRYCPEACVEHRIDASRMTVPYYLRWWRGYGRASVRAAGRPAGLGRWRAVAREARGFVLFSTRASLRRPTSARGLRNRRKRAEAAGRLVELLGL